MFGILESQEVKFTYSSKWEPTEYQFKDRNKLQKPLVMRRMEIHWLSILNSVGLVLLLTGFLAIIINRILRKDIVRYTKSQDLPSSSPPSNLEGIFPPFPVPFPKAKKLFSVFFLSL